MRLILEVVGGPGAGHKRLLKAGQSLRVGRTEDADFVLSFDPALSGVHFAAECQVAGCRIKDLNSRNGTFVNGQRVEEAIVSDGDEVEAGKTRFAVHIEGAVPVAANPPSNAENPRENQSTPSPWTAPPAPDHRVSVAFPLLTPVAPKPVPAPTPSRPSDPLVPEAWPRVPSGPFDPMPDVDAGRHGALPSRSSESGRADNWLDLAGYEVPSASASPSAPAGSWYEWESSAAPQAAAWSALEGANEPDQASGAEVWPTAPSSEDWLVRSSALVPPPKPPARTRAETPPPVAELRPEPAGQEVSPPAPEPLPEAPAPSARRAQPVGTPPRAEPAEEWPDLSPTTVFPAEAEATSPSAETLADPLFTVMPLPSGVFPTDPIPAAAPVDELPGEAPSDNWLDMPVADVWSVDAPGDEWGGTDRSVSPIPREKPAALSPGDLSSRAATAGWPGVPPVDAATSEPMPATGGFRAQPQLDLSGYQPAPDNTLYAVVDAAFGLQLTMRARELELPICSLIEGDLSPQLAAVSPYLVQIDLKSAYLERWSEYLGRNAGLLLESAAGFDELLAHLRRLFHAVDPQGSQSSHRFYDPRLLRAYLPTCSSEELRSFFGPVSCFVAEGEEPGELLHFELASGGLSVEPCRTN